MHQLEDQLSSGWLFRLLNFVKRSPPLGRLAWRALRQYQTISGTAPDELSQLRRMEPAAPPPDGRRVLLFTLRGWTTHLAWETTIARALHLRNARTLAVLCDRILAACEPRTSLDDFESTCERCARQSSRFLAATGLPHRWLGEFVSPAEAAAFRRQTESLTLPELQAFTAHGLPIGRLVRASVHRHLLRGNVEPRPEHVAAYRRFVAAGLAVQAAVGRLLDEFRPDVVLALNGLFYAEAILMALARARGLSVWTYERGKKVDALTFAHNEPVVRQAFESAWHERSGRPLTPLQEAALDDYLGSRAAGQVGIERLWGKMDRVDPLPGRQSQPTAVLFTNVLWDTAVHDADMGFDSMTDWAVETVRWFAAHPGWRLVVRIHPAEVRIPFKASRDPLAARLTQAVPELPPNVRMIFPDQRFNSYELMDGADVALIYTSTVGLETAVRGVPTVVAGRAHYRARGFTADAGTAQAYWTAIEEAFARQRMTAAEIELARRYAYMFFFEEIVPFGLVHEQPRSYVTFRYHRNSDLLPGRDVVLDAICDSILTGERLVNPHAE